jgi:hypothetical protein
LALLPLCAAFSKASGTQQVAATGLTVTVTLKQVKLSDNSLTTLVSGGSAFEVGGGVYGYTYSGTLDFTTYYYAAAFHTADAAVQAQDVAAAYFDFPLSLAKDASGRVDVGKVGGTAQTARDLGANLDAAVSSRSTFAGGAVASVTADVGVTQAAADKVWLSAARTLTGFGTLVADVAAAVWAAATRTLTAFGFTVATNANATETAVKATTDRLAGLLEHPTTYDRFTAAALEQAPGGGGSGGTDWTDPERQQIRQALGVAGAAAATTGAGNLDAVLARTRAIGAGAVLVNAPVTAGGRLALRRGDDYLAADGRDLRWAVTGVPDLTGAAVTLTLYAGIGGPAPAVLTLTGTAAADGSGGWAVSVPVTAAQTSPLAARQHQYVLAATLASGHKVTLAADAADVKGE